MNQKYLFALITISLLTGAGIYSWNYFMPVYANKHAFFILAYYFLFTLGLHWYLTKKSSQDKSFIMKFMGVTGIKLFLNLIVILVYGLNNKAQSVTFALMFMIVYFVFTIFECRQLINAYKPNKENNV
ncbi:MAG: hypothetical protein IAF38_14775 [Bacteroidia bacterium]|nr:hypothetical protein [Bacteroidia bacterium]